MGGTRQSMTPTNLEAQQLILNFNNLEGFFFFFFLGEKERKKKKNYIYLWWGNLIGVNVVKQFYPKFM